MSSSEPRGDVLTFTDAYDQADMHARAAEQHARRHGLIAGECYACMMRAIIALHRGALLDAEALLLSVFAIVRQTHDPYVEYQAQQVRVGICLERGDLEGAERACDALAQSSFSPIGAPLARGRLFAARAEHELAIPCLRAGYDMLRSAGIWRGSSILSPRPNLVFSLTALGQPEEALRLAREEEATARRSGAPSALATAILALGHAEGAEHRVARFPRRPGS